MGGSDSKSITTITKTTTETTNVTNTMRSNQTDIKRIMNKIVADDKRLNIVRQQRHDVNAMNIRLQQTITNNISNSSSSNVTTNNHPFAIGGGADSKSQLIQLQRKNGKLEVDLINSQAEVKRQREQIKYLQDKIDDMSNENSPLFVKSNRA